MTKMFKKLPIRALQYILVKSYPHDPLQAFFFLKKDRNYYVVKSEIAFQKRFVFLKYRPKIKVVQFLLTIKTLSPGPEYLENAVRDFVQTTRTLRQVLEEQAPSSYCEKKNQCREKHLRVK